MNKHLILPFALLLISAVGCSSVPTKDITVQTEVSPTANLGGYTSYAWLGAAALLNDPAGQWKPRDFDADTEIKFLIDRELRAHGLSETSSEPGLLVAFAVGVDMAALELKTDPQTDLEVLTNVPRSGLLVALVDGTTGYVVWAGVARGEVQSDLDAAQAKARLDHAISKMFDGIPW